MLNDTIDQRAAPTYLHVLPQACTRLLQLKPFSSGNGNQAAMHPAAITAAGKSNCRAQAAQAAKTDATTLPD
jgi:hypothetical protein